jgi:HEPN domain-containing protein
MSAADTLPSSIPSEVSEAQSMFPSVKILTSTSHFIIATYKRTPYTRIKFTLTFPDGYPSHPLIVNIDQDAIVPPGLKKKLEKELEEVAKERAIHSQYDQVRAVWERLTSFIDANMFVPCWKELKKCVDLIQGSNNTDGKAKSKASTISLFESKGKIKINLHNEKYFYNCNITIDPAYPDYSPATGGKACLLQLQSTNFPSSIENLLTSQAQEIVRRMQEGLSQERALVMSNPIRLPKTFHLNREDDTGKSRAMTQETIKNIKHDTETLKRVNELRNKESAAFYNGQAGYQDCKALAKERKDARRNIHKLTELERAADQKAEEKEKEWILEEKKRLEGYYDLYNVPDGGTIDPQPCLYVLVKFLLDKVHGLVEETCPCCKDRVLPLNPDVLKSMYGTADKAASNHQQQAEYHPKSTKKKMKPMRTYCGCWYHKSCLNTLLTEPPFGIECPTPECGRQVFHPDWPGDIRQLEREWAAREAKKREIEDVMNCF